jgi:hypothetical protein
VTDLVNNNRRWFERVFDELQSGIELIDEAEIRRPVGEMLREVEPRDTRKIEPVRLSAPPREIVGSTARMAPRRS